MNNSNRLKTLATAPLAAGLLLAGCSTSPTFVNYDERGMYSTQSAGNVPYVEIGPVAATERGFLWERCRDLAESAAEKLHARGERHGATHVIDVRWLNHADGTFSEQPVCTTGWGWLAAAGVGGLAPWVKVAEVHGSLATVEGADLAGARDEGESRAAAYRAERAAEERAAREAAAEADAGESES